MSLAILFNEHAITFRVPDASTIASCAASASNLFGAVTNGRPVSVAMRFAISTSYLKELIVSNTNMYICMSSHSVSYGVMSHVKGGRI